MTAESERGTSETGVDRKSTTTPMDSPEHFMDSPVEPFLHAQEGSSADESAEDLRYRADSLLDEMMLSAVDVSAADYGAMAGSGDGFDGDRFDGLRARSGRPDPAARSAQYFDRAGRAASFGRPCRCAGGGCLGQHHGEQR